VLARVIINPIVTAKELTCNLYSVSSTNQADHLNNQREEARYDCPNFEAIQSSLYLVRRVSKMLNVAEVCPYFLGVGKNFFKRQ
jgi:hypothetical protein